MRKRKLHRTKAYEWLLVVSHMVLIATGSQLTRHQQVEDKAARKDPATWPCAMVCIDQGSGRLVSSLLLHGWCHRVWNNVELAIADMGWRYTVLLGDIMLNLDHGPWAGHMWFAEMVAGAEVLLPNIVLETGMSMVDVNTKAQRDELFKSLISAVQHKQEKVGTSMWFQFIYAMEGFLKIWSKGQCIGLYCSLQRGLFAKGAAALKVHLKPRDADKDVEKSSTKEDKAEVQRARSAAKNTMELMTAMLADRNLFSRFSIILTCARPSLELYHEYNVNNRSAKESLKCYQDRAMDLGLPCINATIELLGDVGLWDKIGGIRSANCPFTHLRFARTIRQARSASMSCAWRLGTCEAARGSLRSLDRSLD